MITKVSKGTIGVFAPVDEWTRNLGVLYIARLGIYFKAACACLFFFAFVTFAENAWHDFLSVLLASLTLGTAKLGVHSSHCSVLRGQPLRVTGSIRHCPFLPLLTIAWVAL